LRQLAEFGQSVWLDFIERRFLTTGTFASTIADDGVSGITSNPAIFYKAIVEQGDYQIAIDAMAHAGLQAHEIHEALMIDDIRRAADQLAGIYSDTAGRDGYVSLEVSPGLARDAEGSYWEAKRLWALVNRPNLMIKVPGTCAGISVVRRLIADGVNVNVTLLFSIERYVNVANAYLAGLEDRFAQRQPIEHIASVASFFVSRIDTLVDARLDALSHPAATELRGKCAIACARIAYDEFESLIRKPRWQLLVRNGAQPQRLLWASTGTKDAAYSDVKYVEPLIGPMTVTTLPPETMAAYRDHGRPAMRLNSDLNAARDVLSRLLEINVDLDQMAQQLEEDGIRKFLEPHDATLQFLRSRIGTVAQGGAAIRG
jgi:transaldolase